MTFGVYAHIPYCKARCPYCDFNIAVDKNPPWRDFGAALLAELESRAAVFEDATAVSLYFGGGTPSLAPVPLIEAVVNAVRQRFGLAGDAEVTLEAEPATATRDWLAAARAAGVSRLSCGWQSTDDRLLKVLGRGHDAADSRRLIEDARRSGFDNISIDLIFAVPSQTLHDLGRDLEALVELAPEHVSLYALTYKDGTNFHERLRRGSLRPLDEEGEIEMMGSIDPFLRSAGYEHYEVSNYARPGRRAVHNTLYWTGGRYLGLGPGAHSFHHDGWTRGWRWEGTRDPAAYRTVWQQGRQPGLPASGDPDVSFVEQLSARQLLAERIMCAMRFTDGCDLAELPLGAHAPEVDRGVAEGVRRGWIEKKGSTISPTPDGMRNADAVALLFF